MSPNQLNLLKSNKNVIAFFQQLEGHLPNRTRAYLLCFSWDTQPQYPHCTCKSLRICEFQEFKEPNSSTELADNTFNY